MNSIKVEYTKQNKTTTHLPKLNGVFFDACSSYTEAGDVSTVDTWMTVLAVALFTRHVGIRDIWL